MSIFLHLFSSCCCVQSLCSSETFKSPFSSLFHSPSINLCLSPPQLEKELYRLRPVNGCSGSHSALRYKVRAQLLLNLQRLQPMKVLVVCLRVKIGLAHLRRSCNSLMAAVCAMKKSTKAPYKYSAQCACHCGRCRQNI